MAGGNIFTDSMDQLNGWLQTPDGRLVQPAPGGQPTPEELQSRTPHGAPFQPQIYGGPPVAASLPYRPGVQGPTGEVSPAPGGQPTPEELASRTPHAAIFQPQIYGGPPDPVYPEIRSEGEPYDPLNPTGQVTGPPTGTWSSGSQAQPQPPATMQPTGQVTGTPTGPFPSKVTHTVHGPGGKTTITHANTPLTVGNAGSKGQGGGQGTVIPLGKLPASGPAGPAPATGGNTTNVAVPNHPGLLQRIGQTISHFFGGTLGQHANDQQGAPAAPTGLQAAPQDQTSGSALSGVNRALHGGRQRIATHGGTAPASAAAPSLAFTDTGQPQPLGDATLVQGDDGHIYRADVTNPLRHTLIQ
jgi:hypothetical protein